MEQRDQSNGEGVFTRIAARMRFTMLTLFAIPLLFLGGLSVAATAEAYDVSGTVSYSGTATGRIYLTLYSPNGILGTSIAPAETFTIRGVPAGNYVVQAFLDARNTGSRHASDPSGISSPFTVSAANVSGIVVTLNDPLPIASVPTPTGLKVFPGDGGALAMWDSNLATVEQADSYNLYWSASSTVTPATSTGSKLDIPAIGDMKGLVLSPLTNGEQLYFVVTAKIGGVESPPSAVVGPVTIGAQAGYSVSGLVNIPAVPSSTVPLYLMLENITSGPPAQLYIKSYPGPLASTVAYTVAGVANGNYRVRAFLDKNSNGLLDSGDLVTGDAAAPAVTVSNGPVSNADFTITGFDAAVDVRTSHWKSGGSEKYGLSFDVREGAKRPVKVTLTGGPNVTGPLDIGLSEWGGFFSWIDIGAAVPLINDEYFFDVTYADGSTGAISGKVTGVLNLATPDAPLGAPTYVAAPTFSWSAPSPPPSGPYSYGVSLQNSTSATIWSTADPLPSSPTSVTYNSSTLPALPDNSSYTWDVMVFDLYGNMSSNEASFTYGTATASGGSISGTVKDAANNTPLPGIRVWVYDSGSFSVTGLTDSSGNYTIGNLPDNTYRVAFNDGAFSTPNAYAAQWYNNAMGAGNATLVTISAGSSMTGINAALVPAGSITGQVTDAASTAGVQDVWVNAHEASSGVQIIGVKTNANGDYTIGGLPAGSYKLYFDGQYSAGHQNLWYDNAASIASAAAVTVNAGAATTANAALTAAAPQTTARSISGTIYAGGNSGRVYITVRTNSGILGTSISAPGPYTIRGVPPGNYTVNAFMDTLNLGAQMQTSPAGSVAAINISTTDVTGADITLTNPAAIAPPAPNNVGVSPGDASVLIGWDRPRVNGVEAADSYDIYWGTSAAVSKTVNTGSRLNVPAGIDSPALLDGLTNGAALYFIVVPKSGSAEGTSSAVVGPVTVGAATGGNTVSGAVSYSGATPTGPLYIAVVSPQSKGASGVYFTRIANPSSAQTFSVGGVPDGTYEVYALYDMNSDKLFGNGDITNADDKAPIVNLSGAGASGVNISLAGTNADVIVTTNHGKPAGGTGEWYSIDGAARGQLKRPVAVTLTGVPSASLITVPIDLGVDKWGEFRFWSGVGARPTTDDAYIFDIMYADGSSESKSAFVSGVSDNFPYNPQIGGTPSTVPTFTWGAPTTGTPPGYTLWVGANYNNLWDIWALPGTQTAVTYNFDGHAQPLQLNTQYDWNISALDQNGNRASIHSTFTPTIADTVPPTVDSTTPAGGATGVAVNSVVKAVFSELINPGTLNDLTGFLKDNSGAPVAGWGSYDPLTRTVTFKPAIPLAYNTLYTATATTGVKDLAGNPLAADVSISFTTVSAPVAPVTLTNLIHTYTGTGVGATVTTAPPGLPVTVTYNGSTVLPVAVGTYNVTATINDPNYQGSANGTLTIVSSYSVPPTVEKTEPSGREKNVATDTSISVTFSEPVIASSVNLAIDGGVSGQAYVSATNSATATITNTVTFQLSQSLAADTDYTVTVSGNGISPYTWQFRTASLTKGVECDDNGLKVAVDLATTDGKAKVQIPAGTVLSDISGKPLTGALTMKATPTQNSADVPGITSAVSDNGQQFGSLGAAIDIVITAGTALVTNLSQSMTVNLKLAPGYAQTGATLTYYSNNGSAWKREGTAVVNQDGSIDMSVGHLSVWAVAKFLPSGKIADSTSTVGISDALKALQIAVGLVRPTENDLANGDVAPLVGGLRSPDGSINVGDAIILLQKTLGLITSW